MAGRAQPLGAAVWLGCGAASVLLALSLGTLGAVLTRAGGWGGIAAADWAAIRFTVSQALVSAALSTILAVPVARALARRNFRGRGLLVSLLGAPFILPVMVAVMGLLAVFGRSGLINSALSALGLPTISIYGYHGVVLAHVFLNLPLAIRLILQGWLDIPAERFRLAAVLGLDAGAVHRLLERPMLRAVLPGTFLAIFLICLTSFAVALTLGGGPRATTVELAIYQAFRFEFDLGHAAVLALVQFTLCLLAAMAALIVSMPTGFGAGLDRRVERWDAGHLSLRLQDAIILGAIALFLLLPLGLVLGSGIPHLGALPAPVWSAALRSLVVALAATALTLVLALPLALAAIRLGGTRGAMLETIGMLSLAASPLVIGTGLFILIRIMANPTALALPVTIAVNAAMALPFALRAILPAVRTVEADYGRLADSLGIVGRGRLRLLILPRLRRPLGFAAGLAAALSMGDLGVIALFAEPGQATLPLQLYRLMASYRMDDAAAAALLLSLLGFGLFRFFDRMGRNDADA
ncbi:MAG: thiamine/thiamine pyrophosphate ABC transporter permease ThiP [Rhodobacteraceae bacterium]|nr:thiamine/thiamine pyrophosphate ABC transporter permease ThiP [Paracoccaceae bacterium]